MIPFVDNDISWSEVGFTVLDNETRGEGREVEMCSRVDVNANIRPVSVCKGAK